MKKGFLSEIFIKSTALILGGWIVSVGAGLLLNSFLKSELDIAYFLFTSFILVTFAATPLSLGGAFFLRSVSGSIKKFWMSIVGLHAWIVLFQGCMVFMAFLILKPAQDITSFIGTVSLDFVWVTLLLFLCSLNYTSDTKALWTQAVSGRIYLRFLSNGALILSLYACMFLFFFSSLAGYAAGATFLCFMFCIKNVYLKLSISPRSRAKVAAVGAIVIWTLFGVSYLVALNMPNSRSWFLGFLYQEQTQSVSPNEMNLGQLLKELDKKQSDPELEVRLWSRLEELCPPIPTDYPLIIECKSEDSKRFSSCVDVFPQVRNEEHVSKLLNNPSIYLQMLGLLKARSLPSLTTSNQEQIQKIYSGGGRLSPVAEQTLKNVGKELPKACIRISVEFEKSN